MMKNAMQAIAILCLASLFAMIAHKGYADISLLAQKYSGTGFWSLGPLSHRKHRRRLSSVRPVPGTCPFVPKRRRWSTAALAIGVN